jgi:alkanesulfonate monooxygenase SsuD/methylene tetrahydromethanopterin reductase-like flavin-dependent oxidoreductase (luciferase family)
MKFWHAVAFLETDQLLDLARAADAAGYHGVTVSDHIFYPRRFQASYPYSPDGRPTWAPDTPWPDPWALISAMAAVTERLRFTTNVYVAPARDLFTVAKLVSTAAVLSGDRVAVGAAAGWCRDEFEQTGQPFEGRGARLDEMIRALRTLWAGGWAEHRGRHYNFDPVRIAPVPSSPIPVYVGGSRSRRCGGGAPRAPRGRAGAAPRRPPPRRPRTPRAHDGAGPPPRAPGRGPACGGRRGGGRGRRRRPATRAPA